MRFVGWLAMALGVIGIIVFLLVAAGVWVVRPNIEERVSDVIAAADAAVERGQELSAEAQVHVDAASTRLDEASVKAAELAGSPALDAVASSQLLGSINEIITGPYQDLRARYASIKERVETVDTMLRGVDKLLPGVSLPGKGSEALTALDERLTTLDKRITNLGGLVQAGIASPRIAQEISELLGTASDAAAQVSSRLDDLEARLASAQESLADVSSQVSGWLFWGAGATTVIGLYLAFLHLLLFQQGRRWAVPSRED